MEYTTHHDVEQRLSELVSSRPPARLMFPLRDVARDALAQGYEKDALIENFESIRAQLSTSKMRLNLYDSLAALKQAVLRALSLPRVMELHC